MIPYEDLVVALQAWRVKQGLPVGTMSVAIAQPPPMAAPVARTAPPAPPPARPGPPGPPPRSPTPPPLAPPPDSIDEAVDDGALIEETHYENDGPDFAMAFGSEGPPVVDTHEHEGTTVDDPNGTRPKTPRNHDW